MSHLPPRQDLDEPATDGVEVPVRMARRVALSDVETARPLHTVRLGDRIGRAITWIGQAIDRVFDHRLIILGLGLLLLMVLQVNFSSIGVYARYLNDSPGGSWAGTILGVPRGIRSDELVVQTPYYLSQVHNGFSYVSNLAGADRLR